MGVLDIITSTKVNVIKNENKASEIYKEIRKFKENNRKEIEDKAERIHPVCKKVLRTLNNLDDTIRNAEDSLNNGIVRSLFLSEETKLIRGDHLYVQRCGYTHHGSYIGNGMVIHYIAQCVREDSLEIFADSAKIHTKLEGESPIRYTRDKVVDRAYSRYGENKYNLLINNCESFVRWCRAGREEY